MTLIYPSYLPSIANYIVFVQSSKICLEVKDNYQKQTLRNRCYIYGSNGEMGLHIPVHFTQKKRQKTGQILIDNSTKWKAVHWKSIKSAYNSSPFFEYYEDDLRPLFEKSDNLLLPFIISCMETINSCLELEISYKKSEDFSKDLLSLDYRFLIETHLNKIIKTNIYSQVFQSKYGYIPNLSILDLMFNLGPQTVPFLMKHPAVYHVI